MKIKYTNGIVQKLTENHYYLTLFNNGRLVYKATMPTNEALSMVSPKIVLL